LPLETAFWKYEAGYWYQQLNSSPAGLSSDYASNKLKEFQPGKKQQPQFIKDVILFFGQFKSPLVLMLVAAVVLSAFMGDLSDVFVIGSILLATGLLSFIQERNAGKVVEKLQSMIELKCTVVRDGRPTEIFSRIVVPGDVLLLKAGDMIPADCLLLESNELNTSESSMTGESYPVRKTVGPIGENTPLTNRSNSLWEGTSVVSGTARALVINTGADTVFGNIAQSADTVTETAFEKGINHFGFFLMRITVVMAITILVINLLFHRPVVDSVLFALALAVGMSPELLPAINTIAMSAGARRMLQQKVIVKKLSAIQNLGEVNLLCTDKTGTITQGTIEVADALDISGNKSEWVKDLACINARFESGYANPLDDALRRLPVLPDSKIDKVSEIPYDFIRKCLSVSVNMDGKHLLITKGALKQITAMCTSVQAGNEIAPIEKYAGLIQQRLVEYSDNGYRVIGVCYKELAVQPVARQK
jgi:Mg2+-importing ATPase